MSSSEPERKMSFRNKEKPVGFTPDETISEAIRNASTDGRLPCTAGFRLSEELGIPTEVVGNYADFHGIRLISCQIGLFGCGKKGKLIDDLEVVDKVLEKAVRAATEENRITCESIFRVADETGLKRLMVGSICQTLGIKIKKCRLGAFK